jgi:hypothetical protein
MRGLTHRPDFHLPRGELETSLRIISRIATRLVLSVLILLFFVSTVQVVEAVDLAPPVVLNEDPLPVPAANVNAGLMAVSLLFLVRSFELGQACVDRLLCVLEGIGRGVAVVALLVRAHALSTLMLFICATLVVVSCLVEQHIPIPVEM